MICVVIARTRHKMIQVEVQEAAKRGAQLIEIRLDFLAKAPDFKRLLANKPCPLLATVRRREDGGRWTGTEEARRMLLRQAVVSGFDWIDLETDVADDIRRFKNVKRIISYHNLEEMPGDLEKLHEQMCRQDPDVVKIAVPVQRPADNLRLLNLFHNAPKPTVAIGMGDLGIPSRILAGRYGAPFTYAAFNKERRVAPGMPSLDELKRIYRYDQLNPATAVYGVIGDPVAHSLSPLIHNAAFRVLGINAVYVPFRVPQGELEAFLRSFEKVPVQGYSVTIPHKEAALLAAKQRQPEATKVQAANTLVRGPEGFLAHNTDFAAARDSLLANLPSLFTGHTLSGRTVLLLGAGGVARALAHVLHDAQGLVTISNRTLDRAQKLAAEVGCRFIPWDARHTVVCDLLVNGTSVGMTPDVDEMPIHPSFLKPEMAVFDTVYTPENTLLVKEARERRCHVLPGMDMFVRQAAMQFGLFTGQPAPLEVMRDVVKRALSPVAYRDEE